MEDDSGWKRLTDIAGSEHVTFDTAFLRQSGWQGELPKACVSPSTQEQVCELMRIAAAEHWKVAPAGNFTKQRMGGTPEGIDLVISLRCLNGITDYQPADLTVSVEAGVRVDMLAAALEAKNQMLPLDVPFTASGATIGGVIATHSSGPRRLGYGSVRDMTIGIHFVTSDGTLAKSGGRVVKNVAGYDMMKLLIGSFGTLGIITGATFKVFPIAPSGTTFIFGFATANQALQARHRILNSPFIPQALDLMDSAAGVLLDQNQLAESPFSLVARIAGPESMVERVRRELPLLVRADGGKPVSCLAGERERQLWHAIQELTPTVLAHAPNSAIVKVSVVLSNVGTVIERARQAAAGQGLSVATLARAGTGIVYCYLWPESNIDSSQTNRILNAGELILSESERLGGWATIEWSPDEVKQKTRLWAPLGDSFPIMQQLKAQLDPAGMLNSGRLYPRI